MCSTYLTPRRPPTFLKWNVCFDWCKTWIDGTPLVKGEGGKCASQQRAAAWWCHMTSVVTFPQAQSVLRRERDGTDWEESSLRAQTPHTGDTHWSSQAYAASVGGAFRKKTPPPVTGLHAELLMMLSVLFKMLLILDVHFLRSFLFIWS